MNAIFAKAHDALKEAEAEAIRLAAVSTQIDGAQARLKQLHANEAELNAELAKLAEAVAAQRKAVDNSKAEAADAIKEGQQKAAQIVAEATAEAQKILKNTRAQAMQLSSNAQNEAQHHKNLRDAAASELKEIYAQITNAKSQFLTLRNAAKEFASTAGFLEG